MAMSTLELISNRNRRYFYKPKRFNRPLLFSSIKDGRGFYKGYHRPKFSLENYDEYDPIDYDYDKEIERLFYTVYPVYSSFIDSSNKFITREPNQEYIDEDDDDRLYEPFRREARSFSALRNMNNVLIVTKYLTI